MLILFPAAALFFTKGFSNDVLYPNKHAACYLSLMGLILGALFCTIDWIFFLPVHFAEYNYLKEFMSICTHEVFIPFLLCFIPLMVFFKESLKYKLNTFAYVLFGFYAVQFPYFIIQRYETLSPFLLFIRPVLQLGLCISAYTLLSLLRRNPENKKIAISIIAVPAFLIMLFAPTFIETTWFLGADAQIWVTLAIIYIFLSYIAFPILSHSVSKPSESSI